MERQNNTKLNTVAVPPILAHRVEQEGMFCVEGIEGLPAKPVENQVIRGCKYGIPQIASVSLSEQKARVAGRKLGAGRTPFAGNGNAIVLGDVVGLVNAIYETKIGNLLGAHLARAEVVKLVLGLVVATNSQASKMN